MTPTPPARRRGSAAIPLRWSQPQRALMLLILLIGLLARVAYADRPFDHRSLTAWREADYTQIARNFYREDASILHPRIDWRGDTPGLVEMEFPIAPWLAARLDHVFGYREAWVRAPSVLASLLSLLMFAALGRRALSPAGALVATALFAVNPLLIYLAGAMQPEALMVLFALISAALLLRWDETPRQGTLLLAAAAAAAAVLAKSPAGYLGLLLAYAVIRKQGWRALTAPRNIAALCVMVVPPLAWYVWASQFWRQYGNSLGVSNEAHFIGWDMLVPPSFLATTLQWEILGVFTLSGVLLAIAGMRALRNRDRLVLAWYLAVWALYVLAARTFGKDWAFYYHAAAVAPACLIMGRGASTLIEARLFTGTSSWLAKRQRRLGVLLVLATLVAATVATALLIRKRDFNPNPHLRDMYECALRFATQVPPNATIVFQGGQAFDDKGHPAAHNKSMPFAWMDRKGFNYADEDLSIATLDRLASRGGEFWFATHAEVMQLGVDRIDGAGFRLVDSCDGKYDLFRTDFTR